MSSLGRIEVVVQDSAGNAVSGAVVQVQKQGAQISGSSSGTSITVDAPNAVVATDTVALNTTTTPTRTVSSVAATNVTVGGPGFTSWSDDDRVSIVSPLVTLYEDPEGNTSKSNPMTTSSTGLAWCYATGGRYDIVTTNGAAVTMIQDFEAVGGESRIANIYPTGSSTVWKWDTLRAAAAGDKLVSVQTAGVEKVSIRGDGEIVAGAAGATHSLTGTLTSSSTITATAGGVVATAGDVTATAGDVVATAGNVVATVGNVQATAGNLVGRRLLLSQGTAATTSDFTISAGWGSTAVKSVLNRGVDPDSTDSAGWFAITCNGAGIGANPTWAYVHKDGSFGTAPIVLVQRVTPAGTGTDQLSVPVSVNAFATDFTVTWLGTPVAGQTYGFSYLVIR